MLPSNIFRRWIPRNRAHPVSLQPRLAWSDPSAADIFFASLTSNPLLMDGDKKTEDIGYSIFKQDRDFLTFFW